MNNHILNFRPEELCIDLWFLLLSAEEPLFYSLLISVLHDNYHSAAPLLITQTARIKSEDRYYNQTHHNSKMIYTTHPAHQRLLRFHFTPTQDVIQLMPFTPMQHQSLAVFQRNKYNRPVILKKIFYLSFAK